MVFHDKFLQTYGETQVAKLKTKVLGRTPLDRAAFSSKKPKLLVCVGL